MTLKLILKVAFSCLLLALLLRRISLEELTNNTLRISVEAILYCIILYCCSWQLSIYKWHLLLPDISFGRLLSVSLVGQFYSAILPGQLAGEVIKTYRLGKGRQDAEHVAASVLLDKLTGLIGLLVVAAGGIMTSNSQVPSGISLSIGLFTLFFFMGLFCLKIPFVYRLSIALLCNITGRWPRFDPFILRLFRFLNVWEDYLFRPLRLIYVFFLGVVFQLICVWINILLAQDLDINVSYADFCWIFGLVSIAVLFPISVGGIGVREGAFAGALSLQGVPIEKSLALSFAVFSISLLGAFIGGLLELFRYMTKI